MMDWLCTCNLYFGYVLVTGSLVDLDSCDPTLLQRNCTMTDPMSPQKSGYRLLQGEKVTSPGYI